WQLAVKLRDRVYEMTATGPVLDDENFRTQIRKSASSAPSNISEGFVRYEPHEFAPFMKTAKGSIGETQNHLKHGKREGYFSESDFTEAWRLACRAFRASNRLHAYLRSCGKKKPFIPPKNQKLAEPSGTEPRGTLRNPVEPRGTPRNLVDQHRS